jgi:threonine/homoserine/homoserine lactone efflux protein
VREIEALVVFGFVSSVTPGPNNALLWASGLQFGFRRTLPQVAGTSVGIGALAVGVAAGIGLAVAAVPGVELGLKVAGSAYLLYLAVRLAGGGGARRAVIARPLLLREAALFQLVNPKAWLFALAAMSAFRPHGVPVVAGSAAVVATMMLVVVPSASLWAAGGRAIQRVSATERGSRALNRTLATLLAATIAFIWI